MNQDSSIRVGSLGERIAQSMRVSIVRGELAAGSTIVEEGLAAQFDVSRGPVRDALKILVGEHLVEPLRRGYRVRGISAEDVDELYDLRGALEEVAVRTAVARGAEADWTPARAHLEHMSRAADSGDWYEYARCDLAFHSGLYDLAGNERLRTSWRQIAPTFDVILQQTNKQDVDLHPSQADHARLLEAITHGRVDDALEYLREHLDGSRRRMKTALAHPRR
jgi:GntR family transcriptional regulator of gluconate operon